MSHKIKQNAFFRRIHYMKHIIFLTVISVFAGLLFTPALFSGCAGLKNENRTADKETDSVSGAYGEYEGASPGHRGIIRVRVGLKNGVITEITVIESREDMAVGAAAIEELTDIVLMYNTTEVDAISGATETSKGFLEAVDNAIMGL